MTIYRTLLLLLIFLCTSGAIFAADDGYYEKEGQFVRVSNNDDGSRTIFKKIPGQRQLVKRTYDPSGTLVQQIIYVSDKFGEMRACKIFDGKKKELFRVAYGYDRFGRLRYENMYDSRSGELVSVFQYDYTADGKRSQPKRFVAKAGVKDINDRFRYAQPSALESDPFAPKKDKDKKSSSKK